MEFTGNKICFTHISSEYLDSLEHTAEIRQRTGKGTNIIQALFYKTTETNPYTHPALRYTAFRGCIPFVTISDITEITENGNYLRKAVLRK